MNLKEEFENLKKAIAAIRAKIPEGEFGTLRIDAPDLYVETFSGSPGHLELKAWERLPDESDV